jgi:hypothetical protein
MGRHSWTSIKQEKWLTEQAVEYLKVKGSKKLTSKFWPAFFDGWKERWPKPKLSVVLNNEVEAGNTDTSMSTPIINKGTEADTVGEQVSASPKKSRRKKPLTVQTVRTAMVWLDIYLIKVVALEAMDE